MSEWTVVTLRAKYSKNYEPAKYNEKDPYPALQDICKTLDNDNDVKMWTADYPHAHVYLKCGRYCWGFAENFIKKYSDMVRDAVVLGANDTSDTGTARYCPMDEGSPFYTDEYKETESEDGTNVGYMALQVIGSRHGIIPRDPWHHWVGELDDVYKECGTDRLE